MNRLKRNVIHISLVFNKMSHFQVNELFGVKPFVMLAVGGQFQEKFVRVRLLNWGATGQKSRANGQSQGPSQEPKGKSQRPQATAKQSQTNQAGLKDFLSMG